MTARRRRLTGVSSPEEVAEALAEINERERAATAQDDAAALADVQHVGDLLTFIRANHGEIVAALQTQTRVAERHMIEAAQSGYAVTADMYRQAATHWHELASRLAILAALVP